MEKNAIHFFQSSFVHYDVDFYVGVYIFHLITDGWYTAKKRQQ